MGLDGKITYWGELVDPIDIFRVHNISEVDLYKIICKRNNKGFFVIDKNKYKFIPNSNDKLKPRTVFNISKDGEIIENLSSKELRKILKTSTTYILDKTKKEKVAHIRGWEVWRV